MLAYSAAHEAREQDAEQEPGHYAAHDLAARLGPRERSRRRHEVLRRGRQQTDREAGCGQERDRGREPRERQHQSECDQFDHDHLSPIEAIAERRKEQNARGIAELR